MKAIWARNTIYSKLLISVGIILLSAITFTLISTLLACSIFHISMVEMQSIISDYQNPVSLSILKLIQTFSAIGTFVIPPFILAYLFSEQPLNYLALNRNAKASSWIGVIALILIATPLINYLGELNSLLHLPSFLSGVEQWMKAAESQAAELTKAFLKMDSFSDLLINLLMIGLIPAIGEELIFRGIVQKLFTQWSKNIHVGIWTAAILFSAMHMQFYGFLPRMMLGALLGYLYAWSGSLWLPILGHFVNNAGAVIFSYLFQHGMTTIDPDAIGTENDYLLVFASLAATIFIGFLIKKIESRRRESEVNMI